MSLGEYREFQGLTDKIKKAIIMGNISHAYIIEGDSTIDKEKFAKNIIKAIMCKEAPGVGCDCCSVCRRIDNDNYEDLYFARADELSVKDNEIEELQNRLKTKPTGGDRNFAIIERADSMTIRAQNRLLKTLEEPTEGTVIFLLSENTLNLLKTVTSRCITYRLSGLTDSFGEENLKNAEKIVDMILNKDYFFDVKQSLEKIVKDRKGAIVFLDSVERIFHMYLTETKKGPFSKTEIIKCIGYIEEARRDVFANVNYRYATRNLIIKLEEII